MPLEKTRREGAWGVFEDGWVVFLFSSRRAGSLSPPETIPYSGKQGICGELPDRVKGAFCGSGDEALGDEKGPCEWKWGGVPW